MDYLDNTNGNGNTFSYIPNDVVKGSTSDDPKVTIVDINSAMLRVGQKRAAEILRSTSLSRLIEWKCGDAENLSEIIESNSFDAYSIAFGIRNCTLIPRVLSEAHRVLAPGGLFACLEFSPKLLQNGPIGDIIQQAYDLYSAYGIPALGTLITGNSQPYQYFIESIRKFPTREAFATMIEAAGFSYLRTEPLSGGICTIHTAIKIPPK